MLIMEYIYIASDPLNESINRWKVGRTKGKKGVAGRMQQLRTGCPGIQCLFSISVDDIVLADNAVSDHLKFSCKYEFDLEWFTAPSFAELKLQLINALYPVTKSGKQRESIIPEKIKPYEPTLEEVLTDMRIGFCASMGLDVPDRPVVLDDGVSKSSPTQLFGQINTNFDNISKTDFVLDIPDCQEWTSSQIRAALYPGWWWCKSLGFTKGNNCRKECKIECIEDRYVPLNRLEIMISQAFLLPDVYLDVTNLVSGSALYFRDLRVRYIKVCDKDEKTRFCVEKYRLYSLNRYALVQMISILDGNYLDLIKNYKPFSYEIKNPGIVGSFIHMWKLSNLTHIMIGPLTTAKYYNPNEEDSCYTEFIPAAISDDIDRHCMSRLKDSTYRKYKAPQIRGICSYYNFTYKGLAAENVFEKICSRTGQYKDVFGRPN